MLDEIEEHIEDHVVAEPHLQYVHVRLHGARVLQHNYQKEILLLDGRRSLLHMKVQSNLPGTHPFGMCPHLQGPVVTMGCTCLCPYPHQWKQQRL